MDIKEMVLRVDQNAIAILEQEVKKKRDTGVANSVSDRFLIRLLDAMSGNNKVFLFKIEKNKLIIRNYPTYDNHRQAGTEHREADGTNP